MTKRPSHLWLVPPPDPFAEAAERAARDACERLAAALLLSYYDKSPATRAALREARSAMVVHRLTRDDLDKIEIQTANAVAKYFLESK